MKVSDVVIIAPEGEGGRTGVLSSSNMTDYKTNNNNGNNLAATSSPVGVPGLGVKKRVRTYSEEVILTSHSLTINLTPEHDSFMDGLNLDSGICNDIRDDRSDIDGCLSDVSSNDTNWADKRPILRRLVFTNSFVMCCYD